MKMTTPKSRRDKAMKLNELLKPRLCIICGARVKNMNPKTNTCDPICTAAKHAGRTRTEQLAWEMKHPDDWPNHDNECKAA
jgi:hypothetical protein